MLFSTARSLSSKQTAAHWFTPKAVKAGDTVVLHTGQGTAYDAKNANGSTTHFIYWGLNTTVWRETGDCAVLFEVDTWKTSKYE